MNEEQNMPGNGSETDQAAGKGSLTTGNTSPSPATSDPDAAGTPNDDYYAVDHAKKDVISTIGDGEMHDEGLVGGGDIPADFTSSLDQLSDEQDKAERNDAEQ